MSPPLRSIPGDNVHTKKPAPQLTNFKITDVKVVDVQREKIDITALAEIIFKKTENGTTLPRDERKLVEPFLDPAYTTDDVPLLERFLEIYENMKAGAYSRPVVNPDNTAAPVPGPDYTETDDDISNNTGGNGLSL